MQAKYLIGTTLVASGLLISSGCQSWPGTGFPLNSGSRVPPPGTGTYPLPNGYYGNTSALAPNGQVMQASADSGLRAPSGALPATNFASLAAGASRAGADTTPAANATVANNSAANNTAANNSVERAQFTAPGPSSGQLNGASSAAAYVASASYSMSDAPTGIELQSPPPSSLPGAADGQQVSSASGAPSLQWQQY